MANALFPGDDKEIMYAPESTYGTEGTYAKIISVRDYDYSGSVFQQITDRDRTNGQVGPTKIIQASARTSADLVIKKDLNAADGLFMLRFFGDTSDSTLETGVGEHTITLASDWDVDSSLTFQMNDDADVVTCKGMKLGNFEIILISF